MAIVDYGIDEIKVPSHIKVILTLGYIMAISAFVCVCVCVCVCVRACVHACE